MQNFNEKQEPNRKKEIFTKESNTDNAPEPHELIEEIKKATKKEGD